MKRLRRSGLRLRKRSKFDYFFSNPLVMDWILDKKIRNLKRTLKILERTPGNDKEKLELYQEITKLSRLLAQKSLLPSEQRQQPQQPS
jgi:hypothetical protein